LNAEHGTIKKAFPEQHSLVVVDLAAAGGQQCCYSPSTNTEPGISEKNAFKRK